MAYQSKEEEELIEPWMRAHVDPLLDLKGRKGYAGKRSREIVRYGRTIFGKAGDNVLFRVMIVFDDFGSPLMFFRMDEYGLPRAPETHAMEAFDTLMTRWARAHLGRSKLDDP